ncbi:MAG: hypothetical protein OXM60_18930 [Defluviicoccus sp.]|nr:hypothetical protein [Defluviicoccus sp.]
MRHFPVIPEANFSRTYRIIFERRRKPDRCPHGVIFRSVVT